MYIFCFLEAVEFEKAINAGYSKYYAEVFSSFLAEYIANDFSRYEDSVGDELVEIERERLAKVYAHLR